MADNKVYLIHKTKIYKFMKLTAYTIRQIGGTSIFYKKVLFP